MRFITIFLIVGILCLSTLTVSAFSFDNLFKKSTSFVVKDVNYEQQAKYNKSITIPNSKYCNDSDNGIYFFKQGTLVKTNKFFFFNIISTYTDTCLGNSNNLKEFYCYQDKKNEIIETCINGCKNGACLQPPIKINCTDSDGGLNYTILGNTTWIDSSGNKRITYDTCSNNGHLLEAECINNRSISYEYTCPNGCKNGICINANVSHTEKNCQIIKKGNGNINFLVVPNRNINQNTIDNGTFVKLAKELFFGKEDAYYYSKKDYDNGILTLVKSAPGFFNITPLNEYSDKINIYYYNKSTSLDCELANQQEGSGPVACLSGASTILDQCKTELNVSKIDRVIVVDLNVGWDFESSIYAQNWSMWFDDFHTQNQYINSTTNLSFFDVGRVAAHEFGHSMGFAHDTMAPLQNIILPVSDIINYSNSQVPPINCDTFSSTKWCNGVNVTSKCINNFQNFLNQVEIQCGSQPSSSCESKIWSNQFVELGHEPISSSCNIGINCSIGGSYLGSCDGSSFLTTNGDSVMGANPFTFNPYESELIRKALNAINIQ